MYLDVLGALNFGVDLLLLLATNRLAGYPTALGRLVPAAVIGGVYGCACILPGLYFLAGTVWRMVFLGIMGGEVIKSASHSSNFHISEGNFGIPLPCVSAEIFYPNENAARRGKAYCGGSILIPFFLRDPAGVSKIWCNRCSQKSRFVKERAWSEYCTNTPEKQRISRREFLKGVNINWEGAEYGGPRKLENYGRISWSIYSDIHIVCALGAGFRIGINPGEIADFILGWCMIDIFHDDL